VTGEKPWWESIDQPPEMGPKQPDESPGFLPADSIQTESTSAFENSLVANDSTLSHIVPEGIVDGKAASAPVVLSPADGETRPPGALTFEGMADPDCTVRLLDWAVPMAEAVVESSGYWSLRLADVGVGDHMYAVLCVDVDGRQSPTCRPLLLHVRQNPTSKSGTNPALTPDQPAPESQSSVLLGPVEPAETRGTNQRLQHWAPTQQETDATEPPPAIFKDRSSDPDPPGHPTDLTALPAKLEPVIGSPGVSSPTASLLSTLPPASESFGSPSPPSRESASSPRPASTIPSGKLPIDSILIAALLMVLAGIAVLVFQTRLGGRAATTPRALSAGLTPPPGHQPAARQRWHFAPPAKGTRTVVITLYNGGKARQSALVMTRTRVVWRVRMPPRSQADVLLPRRYLLNPVTIDSSGAIVSWRTTLRHHAVVRSYGIEGP
jgi:hypothetical protein